LTAHHCRCDPVITVQAFVSLLHTLVPAALGNTNARDQDLLSNRFLSRVQHSATKEQVPYYVELTPRCIRMICTTDICTGDSTYATSECMLQELQTLTRSHSVNTFKEHRSDYFGDIVALRIFPSRFRVFMERFPLFRPAPTLYRTKTTIRPTLTRSSAILGAHILHARFSRLVP